MAILIDTPTTIRAAGQPPKVIEEYIGRVNSQTADVSVARMKSPAGWSEPGQTPEFDEYTIVLHGCLHVRLRNQEFHVRAGQAIIVEAGEWVQYGSPSPEGAEYIAVCLPAFSPATVHRDIDDITTSSASQTCCDAREAHHPPQSPPTVGRTSRLATQSIPLSPGLVGNTPDFHLEPMSDSHGRAVIDIYNHFITHGMAAYPDQPVPHEFFGRFQQMTQGYPSYVAVTSAGQVIGFGFLRPLHPASTLRRTAEVTYFLSREFTRQGIGTALLNRLVEEAASRGIDSLVASISSQNEQSISFHRKNGFQECGRFARAGRKNGQDFDIVWMQRTWGEGAGM